MSMPLRSFWALTGNIHKIEADEDRRALRIAVCAQSSEGVKSLFDEYEQKLEGVVVTAADNPMNAKRDEQGVQELKDLLL